MTRSRKMFGVAVLLVLCLTPHTLYAQSFVGTWVRQDMPMTMTVEMCCGTGRRMTYRIPMNGTETIMVVETKLDGADSPVLVGGQPSGQTMAIRQVDDHHAVAVMKMNGKPIATAKGTLSADGKSLTVEDDYTSSAGGQPVGKQIEKWIRK